MTNKEAIFKLIEYRRRLERDFDGTDYTVDAEPFDMAIDALKAQPKSAETVAKDIATIEDLIRREGAIDAVYERIKQIGYEYDPSVLSIMQAIRDLPSAQPTLYGYNIEHLALIARVMEKEGVSPEKAVETFEDIAAVVAMFLDEQKEIIKKAVEQWVI